MKSGLSGVRQEPCLCYLMGV